MADLEVVRSGPAQPGGAPPPALPEQPVFYFDLGSPESYLLAERVMAELPEVPEWVPVLAAALPHGDLDAFRCAHEREALMERVGHRVRALGLQPLRWPPAWPPDTEPAMLAATFAKQGGRTVSFCQAAFRQAFAGGRDLGDPSTLLIAGAACEMHPRALLKALELRSVRRDLERHTAEAVARGVREVPALRVEDEVWVGEAGLEAAAAALRARAPAGPHRGSTFGDHSA